MFPSSTRIHSQSDALEFLLFSSEPNDGRMEIQRISPERKLAMKYPDLLDMALKVTNVTQEHQCSLDEYILLQWITEASTATRAHDIGRLCRLDGEVFPSKYGFPSTVVLIQRSQLKYVEPLLTSPGLHEHSEEQTAFVAPNVTQEADSCTVEEPAQDCIQAMNDGGCDLEDDDILRNVVEEWECCQSFRDVSKNRTYPSFCLSCTNFRLAYYTTACCGGTMCRECLVSTIAQQKPSGICADTTWESVRCPLCEEIFHSSRIVLRDGSGQHSWTLTATSMLSSTNWTKETMGISASDPERNFHTMLSHEFFTIRMNMKKRKAAFDWFIKNSRIDAFASIPVVNSSP